ncbi:MAG: TetR family transcriptional regulator [Succinivibrio sp.]
MPKRTHEDSLETKKSILASAMRLFARRGFERTSLSDVAKYAGVTRGAIYWHFENKEELLLALADNVAQEQFSFNLLYEAGQPTEKDPLGKLKKWICSLVEEGNDAFINSPLVTMMISIVNGNSGNELLREKLYERSVTRHEGVISALKNASLKGQMPSDLNTEVAAEHLALFCVGYMHQTRMNMTKEIKKNFPYFVDLEFESLRKLTNSSIR